MRCPTCVAEGKTSRLDVKRVSPGTAMRVLAPAVMPSFERFWDEEGKIHVHDHEVRTSVYWCSNGHHHQIKTLGECPREECDWNQQPMVKAGREGLK